MEILNDEKKYNYGGFWVRFVASIIDSIVIYIIHSISALVFFGTMFPMPQDPESMQLEYFFSGQYMGYSIFSLLLDVVYYAGMQSSSKQATIGKMAFDLKVVRTDGSRITFLRGVGRYFSKIVSAIILMIGYIMAAFDSRKQALHDKIADTMVIYEK
ncbi:MAG: hypothetical protein CMC96_08485 [Flavobacteriales bacterium]|nr:hypothetical protein [Flavobacteriales bacterium]MAC95525.1 hypothetical protein [Flavobacteriales bacterium]|tara:strand:- start:23692 stop:24162 length:471 start_codon:yes stop_codon:yes gene_type:complete